ncbi:2-dehydropantoate 2-reductase [Prevotella sp. CAG:924]|nr:2-dehydropantoate 2-reductase [Prevotella sp. CAG:924]
MRYGVIGTGAIGGYYGAKLAQGGQDVHFLFHSDYDYVREHGLRVNSGDGGFHLDHVNAYQDVRQMPKCDVVIVALKTVHEQMLRDMLPPLLTDDTVVLLIQNGMGMEQDVEQMVPGVKLAAGLAFICCSKTHPGVIDHLDLSGLNVGNYNAPQETIDRMIVEMVSADIDARNVDYLEARWRKLLWNMPFNGLSVALHTDTDALVRNAATRRLLRAMTQEVIEAAHAVGVKGLTDRDADAMIEMTTKMRPYKPSMRLDWDYHRPMEVYYLYTRPIEEARRAGQDMPLHRMLEAELRFMEEEYNRKIEVVKR